MTEYSLDNGLKLLILERHNVPVVSFLNYVDVGSVNEVYGITGIAHMFEHMAFKGTNKIGTSDYESEKEAIEKIEKIYM
ncbi:MAG: insulinase family protein, partial [Fidelibacterota bacterium]